MKFITKSASSFYSSFSFKYQKPAICPHCGFGTDAIVKENNYYSFNDGRLLTSVCECTACHKFSFSPAKTLEQIQMMLQWSVCILLLKLSHTKTKI